jgi:hypothetical protein
MKPRLKCGNNNTDKENKMAKSADAARAAAMAKKTTPAKKTGQSGYTGTVSQAVIAQVKKDGMAKALEKVATYKSPSSPYIEAAYRLYGKSRVQAAMSSPAVQKKLSTAGTGGTNPGKFMSPNEIKKFVEKAAKANIALPKAVLDMLKKPGR